eukprot:5272577-Alexandrium_andersonii.AAC.1
MDGASSGPWGRVEALRHHKLPGASWTYGNLRHCGLCTGPHLQSCVGKAVSYTHLTLPTICSV